MSGRSHPRCELPDDIAPTETRDVEIGDPFGSFWAYDEGDTVGRISGGQGGSHINVGFRIAALPTDDSAERCMRVRYERTNATGGTYDRELTFEFERDGDWWESTNAFADQELFGQATLRVTVVDRAFTGTASVTIQEGPFFFDAGTDVGLPDMGPPDVFDAGPPFRLDSFLHDPARHDCGPPAIESGTGMNLSPPMTWSAVPAAAGSLALAMRNLDDESVHWVVYDIPPTMTELPEGLPAGFELDGMRQARSDLNTEYSGYIGPCSDSNRIFELRLYALESEQLVGPDETTTATEVLRMLEESPAVLDISAFAAEL